jgi:RNA polymerase sigma factor (sigma-70 family)
MDSEPEEDLIKLCLQGDNRAWEKLYKQYNGRVRRIVAWPRWGFNPSETEDITQEVFLELVRSLPNFRGEAQLSTFLTHLAKNKCISQIRKKTAKKRGKEDKSVSLEDERTNFDEHQVVAIAHGPTPEEAVVMNEEVRSILRLLPTISSECQQVITLRFIDDLSYEEICQELEIPLGTLCSRLKRCLLKLRRLTEKKVGS